MLCCLGVEQCAGTDSNMLGSLCCQQVADLDSSDCHLDLGRLESLF